MIDWPNVTATLVAALLGGWVATKIAKSQIQAMTQAEREKMRKETGLELMEAIDSFMHIAYRDQDEQSRFERQRLRRRILSLTALTLPDSFQSVQQHLDGIERWWRHKQGEFTGSPPAGMGYTATSSFFEALKTNLFVEIFDQRIQFSRDTGNP